VKAKKVFAFLMAQQGNTNKGEIEWLNQS